MYSQTGSLPAKQIVRIEADAFSHVDVLIVIVVIVVVGDVVRCSHDHLVWRILTIEVDG